MEKLHGVLSPVAGLTGILSTQLPDPEYQEKTVIPADEEQIITPDAGYDGLSRVVVAPIPSNYGKITWNGAYLLIT